MCGALSDERMGLSFTIAAGPCQRSLLWSEPLWARDHILVSQIWDFLFRRLLRLAGSRWRYSTPPPHGEVLYLFYICLAYRIGNIESNSSFLRCHENDPSVAVRTNVYLAVAQQSTVPAGRQEYVYQEAFTYAMDSHVTIVTVRNKGEVWAP
jgi:hypothetical protein